MEDYNINTQEGREAFINNYPTGYYMGADENRNEFVIFLKQGDGMTKTVTLSNGDEQVINYDASGKEVVIDKTKEEEKL